ncbi:McrB family protein [Cloacibacterium caeni]|uniref:McrB family protein n=1 Tax=Cloacibacterium caeni TaxID=2004710 RepID=UPI001BCF1D4B|nr:AAA family ATPase [Cloacibacterium caeni]
MTKYQELQKDVFNWLKSKYEEDNTFTYSVRQKANKGAELNYFIGTERSKYFSTTFWFIPGSYPGSSGDLINLVFDLRFKEGFEFFIQFNQTKNPSGKQNEYALELIRNIKTRIEGKFQNTHYAPEQNKMEFFAIYSPRKYNGFIEIINDLNDLLSKIVPIVNEEIDKLKNIYSDFIAHRFTSSEQMKMFEKMQERFEKYKIIEEMEEELEEEDFAPLNYFSESTFPLNQILYGPPGTGKTYNTINKALEIINEDKVKQLDFNDRKAVKDLFDKKLKEGQIMFTTFHQSMSYEDFIEGIKPEIEEDEEGRKSVIYEVKKGIFKQIAEEARKIRYQSEELSQQYTFDDAWDDLVSEAYEYLEKEESLILNIQTVGMGLKVVDISEKGNLKVQPKSSKEAKIYTVSFSRAKKLQEAFPDLSVIKNIDKEFRAVIGGSNSTAYWAVLNYINNRINSQTTTTQLEIPLAPKPYVLIIDEINRGNVSQIFGELITLIEEDKRLGKNEALEVILPYSKEKFGVPSNLHIIGTMNTADRSVEALDTALRRRFSFVEMMPEYEALNKIQFDDFHLGELLKTINSRIEALLDRDHTIGHSYFINIKPNDTEALKEAFTNKIIPLLQEYFYHDYEKIALILGEGFVECIEPKESKVEFARWNGKTLEKPETSRLFKIKKFDDNFNILDSIKHLLNRVAI